MTDERLKIWLGFWKWMASALIITGGISFATILINAKHKNTELEIAINREEATYLNSFLARALDDRLPIRFKFAQYFAYVSTSDKYKEGWKKYFEAVESEVQQAKAEEQKLADRLAKGEDNEEELRRVKRRLAEIQDELAVSYSETRFPSDTNPLYAIEKLRSYELECPEGSREAIWGERVDVHSLPSFPPPGMYIMYGCHDADGQEVGPYVAWYSDGQIIEDGIRGGEGRAYYPNGTKALEGAMHGSIMFVEKRWNPDGTER